MTTHPELDPEDMPRYGVRAVDGGEVVGADDFATLDEAEAYAEQVSELHPGAVVEMTDRHGTPDVWELVERDTALDEDEGPRG
jgi:hypothetical protein